MTMYELLFSTKMAQVQYCTRMLYFYRSFVLYN